MPSFGSYSVAVSDSGALSNSVSVVVYPPVEGIQPFQALSAYFVGAGHGPGAIAMADVDGDGLVDVILNGPSAPNQLDIAILKGQSDGSLSTPTLIQGVAANALAAGDVNGDGAADIIAAIYPAPSSNGSTSSFTVLLNDGKGNFTPGQTVVFNGAHPNPMILGNFLGSGMNDLVMEVELNNPTRAIYLFPNQGSGIFGSPVTLVSAQIVDFAVADFNGDGRLDIAYSDSATGTHLLLNQGGGNFNDVLPAALTNIAGRILAGDFNGDGLPDLAIESTSNSTTIALQVFLNQGNNVFTVVSSPLTLAPAGSNPFALMVGDFDHDGILDIAGGGDSGIFLWGDGTGNFTIQTVSGPAGFVAAAGDINGDGIPDVVMPDQAVIAAAVALGNSTRSFPQPYYLHPEVASGLSVGDVDGDGYPDLLFSGNSVDQIAGSVFLNQRNGTFALAGRPSYWGLTLVDLNGDGKAELFGNQGDTFMIWPGTGDPNFGSSPVMIPAPSFAASVGGILFADLDGDGLNDLVGPNYIGWNQGNFQFSFVQIGSGAVFAIGDVNHDGRPDLLTLTGTFLNQGNREFVQISNNGLPIQTGDVVGLGDFNGDGILDAAFATPFQGSGAVLVAYGRGDGTFYIQSFLNATENFVGNANITNVLVGDFNGDGFADIITPLELSPYVLLYTSDGKGKFATSYFAPGVSTIYMAAADLNRDGKTEAVLLPSQGAIPPTTAAILFR